MSKSIKSRAWCFTIFDFNNELIAKLQTEKYDYIVYGHEVTKEGRPHLQGFVYYKSTMRFSTLKKRFPTAHWEVKAKKSTFQQASDYCKKDGQFWEDGELPKDPILKGKGEKRRWEEAFKAAEDGRVEDIPYDIRFRYDRNIERIFERKNRMSKKENTETQMEWYWGRSRTGKSYKARTENPDAYIKPMNKWWDGYVPGSRSTVILEDFDKRHADCLVYYLKIWGDKYDFMAERKGGTMRIRPEKVIITSNYHPSDIWTEEQDLEPILERFKCTEFKKIN